MDSMIEVLKKFHLREKLIMIFLKNSQNSLQIIDQIKNQLNLNEIITLEFMIEKNFIKKFQEFEKIRSVENILILPGKTYKKHLLNLYNNKNSIFKKQINVFGFNFDKNINNLLLILNEENLIEYFSKIFPRNHG